MNTNNRVDVNGATPSYRVVVQDCLMSQEAPYEKTDTRLIVTRQVAGEAPTTTSTDIKSHVSYTFAGDDVISIVREVVTTRRYVVYSQPTEEDHEEMFQHLVSEWQKEINSKRNHQGRPKGITERLPRAVCYSTCCGTPNRRTRNGTCAGCRPNRYPLPQ